MSFFVNKLNGWLILDKPEGITSAKLVAEVKRLTGAKKIGHTGTLDPFASGVLPLALGEATKVAGYGLSDDKEYQFTVTFGEARDTDDRDGKVVETREVYPTRGEIEAALPEFIGEIAQVPPVYSAIKVNGKRAYARARAGETVEMKPRSIRIYSLNLMLPAAPADSSNLLLPPKRPTDLFDRRRSACSGLARDTPSHTTDSNHSPLTTRYSFRLSCGKGTYVRALAKDIAAKLGTVAYVSALRRTRAGKFTEEHAITLATLKEIVHKGELFEPNGSKALLPVAAVLDDIPVLQLDPVLAQKLRYGQSLHMEMKDQTRACAFCDGVLIALVTVSGNLVKAVRVFNI